jgi:hypothetical protein
MAVYEAMYIPLGIESGGAAVSGTWTYVSPIPPNFISEILIDNTVVWSAINSLPEQELTIDTVNLYGKHRVRFRIRLL